MNENRLTWVGWNDGRGPMLWLSDRDTLWTAAQRLDRTGDPYVEITKAWWERLAVAQDWKAAAELGKLCSKKRPNLAYGWENWAWGLHKQGETASAYQTLAPILKRLKLPGPPSGRAAYCLACFCGALGRIKEGTRWLRLAYTLAADQDAFRIHAILEPDLREVWPGIPELNEQALSILE